MDSSKVSFSCRRRKFTDRSNHFSSAIQKANDVDKVRIKLKLHSLFFVRLKFKKSIDSMEKKRFSFLRFFIYCHLSSVKAKRTKSSDVMATEWKQCIREMRLNFFALKSNAMTNNRKRAFSVTRESKQFSWVRMSNIYYLQLDNVVDASTAVCCCCRDCRSRACQLSASSLSSRNRCDKVIAQRNERKGERDGEENINFWSSGDDKRLQKNTHRTKSKQKRGRDKRFEPPTKTIETNCCKIVHHSVICTTFFFFRACLLLFNRRFWCYFSSSESFIWIESSLFTNSAKEKVKKTHHRCMRHRLLLHSSIRMNASICLHAIK